MEEALITSNLNFDNENFKKKNFNTFDKIDDFYYYTFEFNTNNNIVTSKFDGKEWKLLTKHLVTT